MAGNKSLHEARTNVEDEFYTQISDIEKELRHYSEHFKDKIVFCNCDDPEWSSFCLYFQLNFMHLGLKKLIATHFETDKPSYKLEYAIVEGENGQLKLDVVHSPLKQNGDFRSPECIDILKEADIVVTNPPFSLFREYIALLLEHEKKFLIIGNQNNIAYKEVFPLLRDNKMWLGYYSGDMAFKVPEYYEPRATRYWQDESGQKWRSLGNICWYTNLDIKKRHENILLYRTYTPEEYVSYCNYEGINVDKVADIPCDYDGVMGVPVTFMQCYNPEQFEIIGLGSGYLGQSIGITGIPKEHKAMMKGHSAAGDLYYIKDGKPKVPYSRILIRRKQQ